MQARRKMGVRYAAAPSRASALPVARYSPGGPQLPEPAARRRRGDDQEARRHPVGQREAGHRRQPVQNVSGDEGRRDLAAERAAERPHDRVHAAGDTGLVRLHGADDQVAERRERQPDADAQQRAADQDVVRVPVLKRRPDERDGCDRRAHDQRELGPVAARDPAGHAAERTHPDGRRQQVEARDHHRRAEAEAGALGQLRELREQDERRVHAGPDQEGGEVRRPDAADPHHRHVDQRVIAADLDRDPQCDHGQARRRSAPAT